MENIKEYHRNEIVKNFKEHDNIVIEMPTGSGKGIAMLSCIQSDTSKEPWYILVPDILQQENMFEEIKKWNLQYLLDEGKIADILCYASMKNLEGKKCNLALNEVHHLSDNRASILSKIHFNRFISDSATIPHNIYETLQAISDDTYYYRVSVNEAIQQELIPEPRVNVIMYDLDDKERNIAYTSRGQTNFYTQKGYINIFNDKIKKLFKRRRDLIEKGKGVPPWILNRMKIIGANRKKAIADTKDKVISTLISRLRNKRTIFFCGSVDQAIRFGKNQSIHYKNAKKKNIQTLEDFNQLKFNHLFTNKIGKEGLNLNKIECVVIVQLSSGKDNGLELIQKAGRGLRAENPDIYIIVANDTQDEKFMKNNITKFDDSFIDYTNYSDYL